MLSEFSHPVNLLFRFLNRLNIIDIQQVHHSNSISQMNRYGYSVPDHWIPLAITGLGCNYIELKPVKRLGSI